MFTLQNFFCFISLRTGTLCIGMLYLMMSILHFFFSLSEQPMTYQEGEYKAWMVLNAELGVINGLLLFGAVKDSKYFLIPWIAFYGSTLVVGTFAIIAISVIYPLALALSTLIAPFGYFWFVVLSYYVSLDPTRNFDESVFYNQPMASDIPAKYPEVV